MQCKILNSLANPQNRSPRSSRDLGRGRGGVEPLEVDVGPVREAVEAEVLCHLRNFLPHTCSGASCRPLVWGSCGLRFSLLLPISSIVAQL